jgi:hypothetical protein
VTEGFKPLNEKPSKRPLLFLDVDGVISLFGFPSSATPPGTFHWVDGIVHCIGHACGNRVRRLGERFEIVWATGWEEKANEYLVHLLELEAELPVLSFDGAAVWGSAHWKLAEIEAYAGDRPAAWIDDNLSEECLAWARGRRAPTLLIGTDPAVGIEEPEVERLLAWAETLGGQPPGPR